MERLSDILKSGVVEAGGGNRKGNGYSEKYPDIERSFSKACNGFFKYQQEYMKQCVAKEILKLEVDKLRK